MEKYGQEQQRNVWQVFWIMADKQEHLSFLLGQNDTETSAKICCLDKYDFTINTPDGMLRQNCLYCAK